MPGDHQDRAARQERACAGGPPAGRDEARSSKTSRSCDSHRNLQRLNDKLCRSADRSEQIPRCTGVVDAECPTNSRPQQQRGGEELRDRIAAVPGRPRPHDIDARRARDAGHARRAPWPPRRRPSRASRTTASPRTRLRLRRTAESIRTSRLSHDVRHISQRAYAWIGRPRCSVEAPRLRPASASDASAATARSAPPRQ